jgi:hypothetical protein
MSEAAFEGWAVLELMGHRKRPGYVKEVEIAGGKMLRIDIPLPAEDGKPDDHVTEYYGVQAVYALRPCSEDVVKGEISRWSDPRPVRPVDYRAEEPARLGRDWEDE